MHLGTLNSLKSDSYGQVEWLIQRLKKFQVKFIKYIV